MRIFVISEHRCRHEILLSLFYQIQCYKLRFHTRDCVSSIRTDARVEAAETRVQGFKKSSVYLSFHSIHRLAQSHHAAIHGDQSDDGARPGRRGLFVSD